MSYTKFHRALLGIKDRVTEFNRVMRLASREEVSCRISSFLLSMFNIVYNIT